jgi:hypothetical protein
VSQKHIHKLNAHNSHVNNDGILCFTGIGVECSEMLGIGALLGKTLNCVKENGISKFNV